MNWNLNYITEVWYKNSYTLKDSIYPYENNVYLSKLKVNFLPTKFTFLP